MLRVRGPPCRCAGSYGRRGQGSAPCCYPLQPARGRPRHDHRTVLASTLWVVRSNASWRAMPVECGKWETAYKRYRLWRATGLWPRILAALPEGASQVSP